MQQKALFLGLRHRYELAFSAIDAAIVQTNGRNWTIQNSHARLLFRANINKVEQNPQVEALLDRSMSILERCYFSDRRKTAHAMTFADHAVQYWDVIPGERSAAYLSLADQWLAESISEEPWMRRPRALARQVQRRLQISAR